MPMMSHAHAFQKHGLSGALSDATVLHDLLRYTGVLQTLLKGCLGYRVSPGPD